MRNVCTDRSVPCFLHTQHFYPYTHCAYCTSFDYICFFGVQCSEMNQLPFTCSRKLIFVSFGLTQIETKTTKTFTLVYIYVGNTFTYIFVAGLFTAQATERPGYHPLPPGSDSSGWQKVIILR